MHGLSLYDSLIIRAVDGPWRSYIYVSLTSAKHLPNKNGEFPLVLYQNNVVANMDGKFNSMQIFWSILY